MNQDPVLLPTRSFYSNSDNEIVEEIDADALRGQVQVKQ
jgi:hypothetical protein